MSTIDDDRSRDPVYPPTDQVFRALELTWCESTRVVILGQDPYAHPGQADGLCFSVPCGVPRPHSLAMIHRELRTDVSVTRPSHGSLTPWAHRGILLLNTSLTVRGADPLSHQSGWRSFTDRVIELVAQERDPVFLLLGKKAQQKAHGKEAPLADSTNVVEAPHPRHYTFLGSEPFSRVNCRLRKLQRGEMDWGLDP